MRVPEGARVVEYALRVGYIDTDRAQVMHHAAYLRYLEFARVEYLRQAGVDYKRFELEGKLQMPVVEAQVRYHRSALFDDALVVKTWVGVANRAKLRFDSVFYRGDEALTSAQITLACIRLPEGKLVSMPEYVIALGRG
ncbi:MAG TPA: thioesterase family protein [Polyangiales bacterium]|nr:thioesterase family protein [Polyangiales bacterium]